MNFKDSVTYKQLVKAHGREAYAALRPFHKFASMGTVSSTEVNRLFCNSSLAGDGSLVSKGCSFNFPEQLAISGGDAEDNPRGSGASKILLVGLNNVGESCSEIVTLNGSTGVTTDTEFVALNEMQVVELGTSKASADTNNVLIGNLIARVGSGAVLSGIEAGDSRSNQGHFTVPNQNQLYLTDITLNARGSGRNEGSFDWSLWGSTIMGTRSSKKVLLSGRTFTDKKSEYNFKEPLTFEEFHQFWFTVESATTTLKPTIVINGYLHPPGKLGKSSSTYDLRYKNPNVKTALWTKKGHKWRHGTKENY